MSYVRGDDRGQVALLPAAIEDYVAAAAPVRVIDAFVVGLDMACLGFGRAVPASTGRPPYDPRDLLKLYIWGYFNEVRSSRRLERECGRNVEAMWLLRRLRPDFKTIADFRRDNGSAIVGACRAFVLLCRDTGLFSARLVALDGSKFRAVASPKKVVGRQEIAEEAARLDRGISTYLAGLDAADAADPDDAPGAVPAAIMVLQTRWAELSRLAAKLDDEGLVAIVEGEEDARRMGIGKRPKPPSYNVQTAVDAGSGLIVHHEVTCEATDSRMLHPIAKATKDSLDLTELTVVADAGYSSGVQAQACEADAIVPCVPANRSVNNQGGGTLFDRSVFTYEPASDSYRCPAGQALRRRQIMRRDACVLYAASDCSDCALKRQCTTAERRLITRSLYEDALERMNGRATPDMMRKRRCAAEHPFGTIKRMMAGGRFLTRNLKGTRTEMALSIIAYNMLRSINIKAKAA
ncbi:MAG: IS1182 family transposase [Hyphomicrobiales bacterium]|nr:MAG: IS1182 family transposase [Hyphomicrobiales bacterium]